MMLQSKVIEIACTVTKVTPHEHIFGLYKLNRIYSRHIAMYLLHKYCNMRITAMAELYMVAIDSVLKRINRVESILSKGNYRLSTQEIAFMEWYKEAEEICQNNLNADKSQCEVEQISAYY